MYDTSYYSPSNFLPGNLLDIPEHEILQMRLNSLDYRTDEFDAINWVESIVIFGCSNVFGTGIADDETISYQLSKKLNRPVINMGVPASSMEYALFNQIILSEKQLLPYAVINLWTSINRIPYFFDNAPYHMGPWVNKLNNNNYKKRGVKHMYQMWNVFDTHPLIHSSFIKRNAELLWKNTRHYQGTFFPNTSNALQIELYNYSDYANDGGHPGPVTARNIAELLAEKIEKNEQS